MKKIICYSLVIFFVTVSFLFSPRQDDKGPNGLCPLNYVQLNKYMGVTINCDSYVFVGGALRPSFLLQQNYSRQARPLYLLIGNFLGYSVYYLSTPLHRSIEEYLNKKLTNDTIRKQSGNLVLYFSTFAGFVILNFLLLLASFLVFEKILKSAGGKWENGKVIFVAFLLLLISNQLVKSFFWTPHQQMFNILTPLLSIFFGVQILKKEKKISEVLVYSLASGIILLVYGNAILLLAALVLSYLLKNFKGGDGLARLLLKLFLIGLVFLIPTLLWILFLKTQGVSYYNHEFEYFREFVWILDCIKNPNTSLLSQFSNNSLQFLKTMGGLLFPASLLLILFLFQRSTVKEAEIKNQFEIKHLLSFIILMISVTFLFYWFMGYYTDRLTYSIAPYLIVLSALLVTKIRLTQNMKYFLIFLVVAYHFFILFFNPVHFSNLYYY